MLAFFRKNAFILLLLLSFIAVDRLLLAWDPVSRYDMFGKNDFQRTVYTHPDTSWPKVMFGNSSVVAAYDPTQSGSGFVNAGMNYGKMTDLDAILRQGRLKSVPRELIIGVNVYTFMDDLPTDPSYIWHRNGYEPYLYFYRDSIKAALKKYGPPLVKGQEITVNRKKLYQKDLYYGTMKTAELKEKITEFGRLYGSKTMIDFQANLAALDRVIRYSHNHGIMLKVLWMPWNPSLKNPDYVFELKRTVVGKLSAADVPFTDWMDQFKPEQFHDLGHLNVERGRPLFTEEMDRWLGVSSAKR